jgi:catechol 2,3-dioxygenase-like lactoylglutathione lyase family enzyme
MSKESPMRLRQIALVGEDLAAATNSIVAVLGLGEAYADPGVRKYGLGNAVWPVGDTFLEVVSPQQPGTTAGRLLEKRGGDGGYMVILQADDIAQARARIAAQGVRVIDQADREGVAMTHLHPRDMGGAILSIDAMVPTARWEWGGPSWLEQVRTDTSVAIVGAELQGDDPAGMAARWAAVLGRPAAETGAGWRIALDGGELRFVPVRDGRGEGLGAFDVSVRDPDAVRAQARTLGCLDGQGEVVLCGTRVRLVQASRGSATG